MSVLQHYFLDLPFTYSKTLEAILPKDKKKALSVTLASTFIFYLMYKIDEIVRPPKNLRHIPHQGFFQYFNALLRDEPILERSQHYSQKYLDQKDSTGLYVRPGRLGWEIQVTDSESIKSIFMKHEFFLKTYNPSGNIHALSYKFTGRNLSIVTGAHWKKQRSVLNPAFHRSLPVQLFGQFVKQMFDEMEKIGNIIDCPDMMERYALDIIGKAGFGFDFNSISERDSEWVNIYNIIKDGVNEPWFYLFPSLDQYMLWLLPKRRQTHDSLKRFHNMLDEIITAKRRTLDIKKNLDIEETEKDLLTLMLEADEEKCMSNEELKDNICLFFVAGHETTTDTLASMIYYLSVNPDIQEKARQEAIDILGDDPVDVIPTSEDLKNMRYINQIIKETLRLDGPVSSLIPREVPEDTELSGTFIPKGTLLTVNAYETHHREKYWKDALKFNPDRFNDEQEKNRVPMSWIPFGSGSRQCVGMNFSLAVQKVLISMLLRKYSFELPEYSAHKDGLISSGMNIVGPRHMDVIFNKLY